VAFFAVAAGDTLAEARKYVGQTISLSNIHQTRVIDPAGKIVAYRFDEPSIEQALKDAKWKYKDEGYDKKLDNVILLLEWGRYADGLMKLKPFLKKKDTAESAKKLHDAVKAEVQGWMTEAEGLKESDPVKAYDLYAKAAAAFSKSDELGKTAAAGMKALSDDKAVKAELSARKMFAKVSAAMSKATAEQKGQVAKVCHDIVKKHPDTPTAEKAKSLAAELGEPVPG